MAEPQAFRKHLFRCSHGISLYAVFAFNTGVCTHIGKRFVTISESAPSGRGMVPLYCRQRVIKLERRMRKILSIAMLAAFVLPAIPVSADPPPWAPAHGRRAKDAERAYREEERFYYRDDHRRHERRLVRYDEVVYRGDDGRYFCRRSDGTTGLIVGGIAGGLIGSQLARGKSAALGTVLGVGAGALIGQAIDKDRVYCE